MNEQYRSTSYALTDEELEALVDGGAGPGPEQQANNPVAGFFSELRELPQQRSIEPIPELHRLFAQTGPVLSQTTAPAATPPIPTLAETAAPPLTQALSPPPTEALLASASAPAVAFRPVAAYQPTMWESIMGVLRPSGPRLLTGLTIVAALGIIGSQSSLFLGDGTRGEDVTVLAEREAPTVDVADPSAAEEEAVVPAEAVLPAPDPVAESEQETPAAASGPEPTPEETTSTTAEPEPEPTTTTTEPEVDPSSTVTTVEVDPVPTTDVGEPTITVESTTSTVATTVTVPTTPLPTTTVVEPPKGVTIAVGTRYRVPADLAPGTYTAQAGEAPCTVAIQRLLGGPDQEQTFPAGGAISFELRGGSSVVTGQGCPTVFQS